MTKKVTKEQEKKDYQALVNEKIDAHMAARVSSFRLNGYRYTSKSS